MKLYIIFFIIFFAFNGFSASNTNLEFFDSLRARQVPIVIYQERVNLDLPIVVINHGYGAKNSEYSFIANSLANHGYFVISIQHDLENDTPLPRTGNLFERRKPLWDRGVKNIFFVLDELKKRRLNLNFNQIILIGHSNGGDISMMFAEKYPEYVKKIISLDSLRYPFNSNIPILRFSAVDTKPDFKIMKNKNVKIVNIKNVKHIELCDRGGRIVNKKIIKNILEFIK